MSRYSHESFFFSQKKRPVTIRVKIHLDKRALSSRRRSTVLKFRCVLIGPNPCYNNNECLLCYRPQGAERADSIESESVGGSKLRSREGSLTSLTSAKDPSKYTVLRLPHLSPKGQHLTGSLQVSKCFFFIYLNVLAKRHIVHFYSACGGGRRGTNRALGRG